MNAVSPRQVVLPSIECAVIARGAIRLSLAEVADFRKSPRVAAGVLKQSDDQTVTGVAAVFQAMDQGGLVPGTFHDCGVVGVPLSLGRAPVALALHRFKDEGAWSVSPHLIPHRSLHSLSGTISQAFRFHGPNLGVGGGRRGPGEGIVAAMTMVAQGVPVVWLVLTGYEPDVLPTPDGRVPPETLCRALALALAPPRAQEAAPLLRLTLTAVESEKCLDFARLARLLDEPETGPVGFSSGLLELVSLSPTHFPRSSVAEGRP